MIIYINKIPLKLIRNALYIKCCMSVCDLLKFIYLTEEYIMDYHNYEVKRSIIT